MASPALATADLGQAFIWFILLLLGSAQAMQTSTFPTTRPCANIRVLQLPRLFPLWLFNLLSLGLLLIVMPTDKFCLGTICQYLSISRTLRVGEYNRTEYIQFGGTVPTNVISLSQRLTLDQIFESNVL